MESTPKRSVFKRATPAAASAALAGDGKPAAPSVPVLVPVRARGVRSSVFNKTMLTSTGLASLDSALGGGIALGTVLCVIEDSPTECHALLLKHFLAQGLVHGHVSALCSADDDLVRSLPAAIRPGDEGADGTDNNNSSSSAAGMRTSAGSSSRRGLEKPAVEHLKIAWRYKDSLSVTERRTASPSSSVGTYI